jgi:hypothetical protein
LSEPADDQRQAGPTERLRAVRRQLDLLAAARLDTPLDAETEQRYRVLCAREHDLLAALSAPARPLDGKGGTRDHVPYL